jgi:riboflavin kinase / FMN adenylyltransferase
VDLIRHPRLLPQHLKHAIVTIGNFDGMHLGHQALLTHLKAKAKALNKPCGVIIFEPQPQEFFSKSPHPRLTTLRQKYALLKQQHIDFMLVLRFNTQCAALSAQDFITELLVGSLQIAGLMVGQDFRFGHARAGDFELLQSYGKQHGFAVDVMPDIKINEMRVSSTQIRTLLKAGDLQQARHLLGRHFAIEGRVIHGDARGRTLNMRTANIALKHLPAPLTGIFVVAAGLANQTYPAVASLGTRPVFGGIDPVLEVHIFDFNEQIYDQHLNVIFLHKLRDEMAFPSVELLQAQMQQDLLAARTYWEQHNDEL